MMKTSANAKNSRRKDKMKEYFCPVCDALFDLPKEWVSPCCGVATNGGEDYDCPECKQTFDEDMEIPKCPNCGNIGDGYHIQPDLVDCFREEDKKNGKELEEQK